MSGIESQPGQEKSIGKAKTEVEKIEARRKRQERRAAGAGGEGGLLSARALPSNLLPRF